MSGYGSFADHLPSVLFLLCGLVFVFVSMWRSERKSRTPTVGRGEAVAVGVRDGRRGPTVLPARHPVSPTATAGTRDGHPRS